MTDLDDVIDELYGFAPGDFVRRRNEFAKQAKADGHRELAQQISALRRPTQSAWAVNQWARREPDGVAAILDLAAELVGAQRRSSADRLRELSGRRQRLVADTVAEITRAAQTMQTTLSDGAIREITQTLRAAIADPEVADDVRRGRLTAAAEYSGFGPAGVFVVPEPVDVPPAEAREHATAQDATDHDDRRSEQIAEAEASVGEAARVEGAAREALAALDDALTESTARADELGERAESLRAELARCEDELRFARREVEVRSGEQRSAARTCAEAAERLESARRRLAELSSDGGEG